MKKEVAGLWVGVAIYLLVCAIIWKSALDPIFGVTPPGHDFGVEAATFAVITAMALFVRLGAGYFSGAVPNLISRLFETAAVGSASVSAQAWLRDAVQPKSLAVWQEALVIAAILVGAVAMWFILFSVLRDWNQQSSSPPNDEGEVQNGE